VNTNLSKGITLEMSILTMFHSKNQQEKSSFK
jgi:hypothetical protein